MSDQSLPFRNKSFMSDLRREYKQRVANFAEDVVQVYEFRAKVDRANRESKEGLGKDINQTLRNHKAEDDITALSHQLGTKVIPEHWYECILESVRENEKLKAQEKMVREKYYGLYHHKGHPRMTRDNGYYTRRMDCYAESLFSPQDTTEDGSLPVKIVKRLEFLKLYGETDISESDFEQDLSARTDIPIAALRPAGV
ncbi:hypothetical protein Forpe1208_v011080 [Fusarium oxysporum f. sp. rapae]|uniref:Uncharacterized protein n=1 Tax=Fusarium oxysporum f. sp. rapae TaxID=485398 RepID=A0A8J5NV95_FUSOX|nr:hypothetical protein Forpe1208_v011080 [Fusarium oxysporum f. sp. rapae]